MKKIILLLAFLTLSASLFAQFGDGMDERGLASGDFPGDYDFKIDEDDPYLKNTNEGDSDDEVLENVQYQVIYTYYYRDPYYRSIPTLDGGAIYGGEILFESENTSHTITLEDEEVSSEDPVKGIEVFDFRGPLKEIHFRGLCDPHPPSEGSHFFVRVNNHFQEGCTFVNDISGEFVTTTTPLKCKMFYYFEAFIRRIENVFEINEENGSVISDCGTTNLFINNCQFSFFAIDYQIGDIDHEAWKPLLPYESRRGSDPILLSSSDFPEAKPGENVRIKVKYLKDGSDYDEVLTYQLIPCAPKVDITFSKFTRCSNSSDGKVKITLLESLKENEEFIVNLFGETLTGEEGKWGPQYTNSEGFSSDEAGTSYTTGEILPPGDYLIKYKIEGGEYNSDFEEQIFSIKSPDPVTFSASIDKEVSCYGRKDGKIKINANGGKGGYKYQLNAEDKWVKVDNAYTGTNHYIDGISAGTYNIRVRNDDECIALNDDGEEKVTEIIIGPTPISITSNFSNPTYNGATDGKITATVSGGTLDEGGKYEYIWQEKDDNDAWQAIDDKTTNELSNIHAGKYEVTVTDANDCTKKSEEYTLIEPEPLTVTIEIVKPISCNSLNAAYGDPSSEGILKAIVLNGGSSDLLDDGTYAYTYTWKKKGENGNLQNMKGLTSDVLSNIGAGEYAVEVNLVRKENDGNETLLLTVIAETINLSEPELLEVNLETKNVNCHKESTGEIKSSVEGGTGEYQFKWNNSETTEHLQGLQASNFIFTLTVNDENECQATANTFITQPDKPLKIEQKLLKNPSFTGATDGKITATVSGGTSKTDGSYNFVWKDELGKDLVSQVTPKINSDSYELDSYELDSYELTLNNVNKGKYKVIVTDVSDCTDSLEYTLIEPEPLTVTIEIEKSISCNSGNTYGDPSSDGSLRATALGGVPFDPKLDGDYSYKYTWKKKDKNGVWQVLEETTTDVLSGIATGHYAVNIEDANGIVIGTYSKNKFETATDITFQFDEPPLLELSFEKQDVLCHKGSDGWAKVNIIGGTESYTTQWQNGDITLVTENLSEGNYFVEIEDSRRCEVNGSIEILQPLEPLKISYTAFSTPTTKGASDGWLEVQIEGGTELADGSYTYTWTDDSKTSITTQTTSGLVGSSGDQYQIRLKDIPSGVYYLTIEDANYQIATTQDGCTIVENKFSLYDPLEASIKETTPISCNQRNTFNNPYSDGQLSATVTGGLPFSTGQQYFYHWKKQDDSGIYRDLPSQTEAIAINLSTGNYALNVEDSRGIVIGIYEGLTLNKVVDVLFSFEEPELLGVNLSSSPISCEAGNDGQATAVITGGTSPFNLEWSHGATQQIVSNLIGGTYLVKILDGRDCEATGQVIVAQPGDLKIEITDQTNPSCYQGEDGSIAVIITGGKPQYTYLWSTGDTTTDIDNLSKGNYSFKITDQNDCSAFIDVELIDPQPIIVDLGKDRTLCNNQKHELDISISDVGATYSWTSNNGFSDVSGNVSLSQSGVYTATLSTGLGCIGRDTIEIMTLNEDIDSQFLSSSQAFSEKELVLINTSSPLSSTVEWIVPEQGQIIEESNTATTILFEETGVFEVTLQSRNGDCYEEMTKPVVVGEARNLPDVGDTKDPFIISFSISPNPTSGQFTAKIVLQEEANISLRLFSLISDIPVNDVQANNKLEYLMNYDLDLIAGIYFLLLETPKGNQIRKVIIE